MKALVVDGYNAIHKIPCINKLMDKSLFEARTEITKLANEYRRKSGGIDKVCVVFDGKDEYRDIASFPPRPDQIFSRSGRGDEEVVRMIKKLSREYDVMVVSDDNFIKNHSRAHKAGILKVSEFANFLHKKQRNTPEEAPVEKISEGAASRINRELEKYWDIS